LQYPARLQTLTVDGLMLAGAVAATFLEEPAVSNDYRECPEASGSGVRAHAPRAPKHLANGLAMGLKM